MKKFLLYIVLMLSVTVLYGQDRTVSKTFSAKPGNSNYTFFGSLTNGDIARSTADTLGSVSQDSVDFVLTLNKEFPVQYYHSFTLDSTSGTPAVSIILYGRVFETETWTQIATDSYDGGGGTSMTATFSSIANQSYAISFTGVDTTATTLVFDTTAYNNTVGPTRGNYYTAAGTAYNAATMTGTMTYTDIASYYRQMKISFVCTGGTLDIDKVIPKLWKREY